MPFELAMIRIPAVYADDLVLRFERLLVDLDALDGTRRGAHTVLYMGAFEGGTRRCGRANQSLSVPENELGVRPHVDQQPVLILFVRLFSQDHRAGIRADKGCNRRQNVNIPGRVDLQFQLTSLHVQGAVNGRHKWRQAQMFWMKVQEKMVHGGISNQYHFENFICLDLCRLSRLLQQFVQRRDDGFMQFLQPILMFDRILNARHHVFAVDDLRVHLGLGSQQLSCP